MRWLSVLFLFASLGCDDGDTPQTPPDVGLDAQLDAAIDDAQPAVDPDAERPDVGSDAAVDAAVDAQPDARSDPSHAQDGPPNYEVVFPQDRVNRLDLNCAPDRWAQMQAQLQTITGTDPVSVPERPNGDGGQGGPPPEWFAACEALQEGDACEVDGFGPGLCVPEGDRLLCAPEGAGPQLPPEANEACIGLSIEDDCVAPFPGEEDGICVPHNGELVCIPEAWLGGGPGPGHGDDPYAAAGFWETKPQYIDCDLQFEGDVWHHIGVRYKGNSTLAFSTGQTRKLPLRFKIDAFEDDYPETKNQRFYGFKHLSTVNQITDASYLRQKVVADLFRAAGVPSPQTAFYRVYIDHGEGAQYFGLYTMTEVVRTPMLAAQFGDDSGNLYKCDGSGAAFGEFHAESFHRKTHKSSEDYSDVQAFITALNAGHGEDDAGWRANLEAVFDVDAFIRFWAANQIIVNWDTYGALAHNYLIYGDPSDGGRLKWIPWDFDLALADSNELGMGDASADWPLLVAIRDDPVYFARYQALLAELVAGPLEANAVIDRFDAGHRLIAPYVTGDEGEELRYTALVDPEDFNLALIEVAGHMRRRMQAVAQFLP